MIYYTNIIYELVLLLNQVQKKEIGFRLLESEKRLKRGESIIRIIFDILVKIKPRNDAELLKHFPSNIRITNLPMQKRRIIFLILEHISATTTRPGMVIKKLMGQVELLWEWDRIEMIPSICEAAIQIARQHGYQSELAWLLHQLARAQHSDPDRQPSLRPEPASVKELLSVNLAEMDRVVAEHLFLTAETILSSSNRSDAEALIAHKLLNRIESIESFEGRIFAYRARMNCLIVLNSWQDFRDTIQLAIADLQSKQARSHPSLRYLLPEYLTFLATVSLHLKDRNSYIMALNSLDTARKMKGNHQRSFIAAYYNAFIAGCVKDGDLPKAAKVVDKLLTHEKVVLPKVHGYLAIYFYQAQDWESAIGYCTKHLTGGTYPYHHKMTFWLMKIICHFELRSWKYIGHVVKDARAALGAKNLGPVEELLFKVLLGVSIKTHPSDIVKKLVEITPQVVEHLSSSAYRSAESTIKLKQWLTRSANLDFRPHQ